jgi:hypothetical protein
MAYEDDDLVDTSDTSDDTESGDVQVASNDTTSPDMETWRYPATTAPDAEKDLTPPPGFTPYTAPETEQPSQTLEATDQDLKPPPGFEPYGSPVAAAPADELTPPEGFEPYNPPEQPRGIVPRMTEGFYGGFGNEPIGLPLETLEKHPALQTIAPFASGFDIFQRAIPGIAGAVGGIVAGLAEKLGMSTQEADRLQREQPALAAAIMTEPFMAESGAIKQGKKAGLIPDPAIAKGAANLPEPVPVEQPGVKNQAWTGPPQEVPAPPPPEQGTLSFGQKEPQQPFDVRTGQPPIARAGTEPQPSLLSEPPARPGIGGGETQPALPLEPPAPAPATPQPELRLEPPPVINQEGQYGFNVTAPHPASRSPMPDTGGVSKAIAPPPGGDQPVASTRYSKTNYPHSAISRGLAAQAEGVPSETGINVVQPGQVEPTLVAGMRGGRPPEAPPAPAVEPPPAPGPWGQRLATEFPQIPNAERQARPLEPPQRTQVATGLTQGVMPEPPLPAGHTRLYQGANAGPREFTTDRTAAARAGAVSHVDIPTAQLPVQFKQFADTSQYTGSKLWESPKYRERLQPTEPVLTAETRVAPRPPEPAPPPQLSTPKLDAEIVGKIGEPPAVAAKPLEGEILPPEKPTAQATSIKMRDSNGDEHVVPVREQTTFAAALDKYGTRKGLIPQLTKFVSNAVKNAIGDMPAYVVPKDAFDRLGKPNTLGLYSREHDHIILNEKYINDKKAVADTILHEGIHGVTSHALISNVPLRDTVHAIMRDVGHQLVDKLKASGATDAPQGVKYGFTNAREFIAEAFSNPAFQKMLKSLQLAPETAKAVRDYAGPQGKIKSAWDAIVNSVRKLLKVPANQMNALEAAMRMTEHAMDINEGIKAPYMKMLKEMMEKGDALTDEMAKPPPPRGEVIARDRFGNEVRFTGATVHEAAIKARAAGYKQIFNTNNTPYVAPKTIPVPPAAKSIQAAITANTAAKPAAPVARPTAALVAATKSDLKTGLVASVRRMFVPMVSESAKTAGAALRKAYGPLERLKEQTASRFSNELHQLANKMDGPAFQRFVDGYESGKISTLPKEQQALAKVLEKNYSDFWDQIKKLPGADKMEATKNYLTHMYDNSNGQVDRFASDWFGAGGGSLHERTHPTFADARKAGLKPLSNNPIEHFSRYSEGISHYLAQKQMMADLEGQGRIGYFGPRALGASGAPEPYVRGAPPEGYAPLKMPWAEKGSRQAYAPRDAAETLNQFYDTGLRRAQTKDIYQFLQQTKNMWTAVELGLSAYHATTMSVESVASGMARALQMAASGNYKGATAQLLKAPAEPVTSYLSGREGRKIYRDPTGTQGTPQQRRIMDIFSQANIQPGNLRATREYDMSKLGNFWDAYKRGSLPHEFQAQLKAISDSYGLKLPAVLLDNVRRAMQTISKPLFEHYIPELKLGTMMKDMEAWMQANPKATDAEALVYARKISDSVDNRMGEMNYNNLFMNKTAKDLGMLTLRSFGFTVGGPIREIGAGAGRLAKTAALRENPLAHFDLRSKAADPRTAYAMAFMPTIAAISAVYQMMRTGQPPDDWRDLVTPKTGGTVKSVGRQVPERILVPGYHKDFLGYFVNPKGTLGELEAKLAAPWTALIEQFTGKDWRDKDYVPPRATTLEWLKAHGGQLGSHMLPIGPKQLAEGAKKGSALTLPEQMLGVRTPGAYMLNPKGLENYLTNQRQRDWVTQEKQTNRQRTEQGLRPLPLRPLPRAP